jgi:outer membrane protein OmpA-like peptidoglycan-associated protein
MRRTTCRTLIVLLLASSAACRDAPPPAPQELRREARSQPASSSTTAAEESTPARSETNELESPDTEPRARSLLDALGLGGGRPIPDGLIPGGDCPPAAPDADEEIAAQAEARVPLKVGLTLTNLWIPNPEEEYECLNQVTSVDQQGLVFTVGCTDPRNRRVMTRRTCRTDLRSARMLHTQVGAIEVIDASGETLPETFVGSTEWSLSRAEFAELKETGATRHHYVQIGSMDGLSWEATAVLRREGKETARVAVNDRTVDLPVIRASGEASLWMFGRPDKGRVTALILDDERFPLLVEYTHSTESSEQPVFKLSFVKISFPSAPGPDGDRAGADLGELTDNAGAGIGEMERRLTEEKRVDVYGIYFDFNSDRIRKESEPILREIGDMLGRNQDWTLSIDGHTDNVGGDAYNLDLSRRRSESVRQALVEHFGIAANRLTTAGHGAFAPKDTNDTPEGRARNRRVELVRR